VYFVVGDADQLYEFQRANGVEVAEENGDRAYGIRDYVVRDLNGYYLSFGQHLLRAGPPIKIERVDVPLRLEKRLAALLQDLAEHKRMSVSRRSRRYCGTRTRASASHANNGPLPSGTEEEARYLITTGTGVTGSWSSDSTDPVGPARRQGCNGVTEDRNEHGKSTIDGLSASGHKVLR